MSRFCEPRLEPVKTTFVEETQKPTALRRCHSYAGFVPYHLQTKDTASLAKLRNSTFGGTASLSGSKSTAAFNPSTEHGATMPSSDTLDTQETMSTTASSNAEESLNTAAQETLSTADDCVNTEYIDTMVAWPDTDDEDEDNLPYGSCPTTTLPWPLRRSQEPVAFANAQQVFPHAVAGAQQCGITTNAIPLSPQPGGIPSRWSPTHSITGEQVRFWPSPNGGTSPTAVERVALGLVNPGANSPTCVLALSSFLQSMQHGIDAATVSPTNSVRDAFQQPLREPDAGALGAGPPPPVPRADREQPVEALKAPAVARFLQPERESSFGPTLAPKPEPLSLSATLAPVALATRTSCEAPHEAPPRRQHAAGAAPPRSSERQSRQSANDLSRAAQRHNVLADSMPSGATTLMVRNLPTHLSQQRILEELNTSGFAGLYDFCYSPLCSFDTGRGKGFAFVNFTTQAAASCFVTEWHGSRRFGLQRDEPALNISVAAVQGKEENMAKWGNKRAMRIRNPKLRPFVRD